MLHELAFYVVAAVVSGIVAWLYVFVINGRDSLLATVILVLITIVVSRAVEVNVFPLIGF